MKSDWKTISLPQQLLSEVEETLKKYPYWASLSDFVRDAVREKLAKCAQADEQKPKEASDVK